MIKMKNALFTLCFISCWAFQIVAQQRLKENFLYTINTESNSIYNVSDLCTDSDKNIFLIDQKNLSVKKFDSNGKYIKQFGRKGKGPGEFTFPTMIRSGRKNEIIIYDMSLRNFNVFSKTGTYLQTHNFGKMVENFYINKNGEYYLQVPIWETKLLDKGQTVYKFERYSSNLKFISTVYEAKIKDRIFEKNNESVNIITYRFSPSIKWRVLSNGSLIIAQNDSEEIVMLDSKGKVLNKLKHGLERKKTKLFHLRNYYSYAIDFENAPQKFLEDIMANKKDYAEYLPFFHNIFIAGEDKIFLQTYNETENELMFLRIKNDFASISTSLANPKLFHNNVVWDHNRLITYQKGIFFDLPKVSVYELK